MKKNIELWVCNWAPNGTNDLLIVNGNTGEVIATIDEATFGIDVMKPKGAQGMLYSESNFVGALPEPHDENYDADMHSEYNVWVKRITPEELFTKRARSPIDPKGFQPFRELARLGIDVGYRYCDEHDVLEEK